MKLNIKFPVIDYRHLLYIGGSAGNRRAINTLIEAGVLGAPQLGRKPVIDLLHSYFDKKLISQKTRHVVMQMIRVRKFYKFLDELGVDLTLDNVSFSYEAYSRRLLETAWLRSSTLSLSAARQLDNGIRAVLLEALSLPTGAFNSAFGKIGFFRPLSKRTQK
ncbi:hypothetical protein [Pseudomonas sp. TR47]|uniref:hypothetical protein n=1 Tax=Pseudomonas sp. TR47 TaxID=3342639 RepID=UPI00376F5741